MMILRSLSLLTAFAKSKRVFVLFFGVVVFGSIGLGALATGGGDNNAGLSSQAQRRLIVTTTGQIGDLAANLVGDQADVLSLLGPGSDPHLYKLTRRDMALLSSADMILANGFHLEAQMRRLLEQLRQSGKPVIEVADLLASHQRLPAEEIKTSAKIYDPHIWLDVANWIDISKAVGRELQDLMPESAEEITANLDIWIDTLEQLDFEIRETFAMIPEDQRILVTSHDAFRYLGKAYGLEVVGIQGLSTESQAGLHAIEALVDRLSVSPVAAVFTESTVSDRNIRAVMNGVSAAGGEIDLGGQLYSDAMGPEGSGAETYIGMMRHNVQTIAAALSGDPQEFRHIRTLTAEKQSENHLQNAPEMR